MYRQKYPLPLIAFGQALGVVGYTFLIGRFLQWAPEILPMPGFAGIAMILSLLVFSVAVSGSLVFGYPLYLLIKGEVKTALADFGLVMAYLLVLQGLLFLGLAEFSR